MMDSDLAMLYQVETKRLNEAVKRNTARFPEEFCFRLTEAEYKSLRSQFATLNKENGRGSHRKYLPMVFNEQGIAMMSAVLHSDVAIAVSIRIMKTFVEIRRFISDNSFLFEQISKVETSQLEYQRKTDEKIEQIFDYISEHEETMQKIFFEGQIYDAFSLIISLIKKAYKEIILIDCYVDIETLNLLSKKKTGVSVNIYTLKHTRLTEIDIKKFNDQYPELIVKYTSTFHDRFLIIDTNTAYHIGASLKDAGKRCFAINHIQDKGIIWDILQKLELESEE